jgi:hypothetical protein
MAANCGESARMVLWYAQTAFPAGLQHIQGYLNLNSVTGVFERRSWAGTHMAGGIRINTEKEICDARSEDTRLEPHLER